jgi:hypothetical protein
MQIFSRLCIPNLKFKLYIKSKLNKKETIGSYSGPGLVMLSPPHVAWATSQPIYA